MSVQQRDTGWKYYLPESGETAADAQPIMAHEWVRIRDAETAAVEAAEDEWQNRDGWDAGISASPLIAIIAPDGALTNWRITREATIEHHASEEDAEQ